MWSKCSSVPTGGRGTLQLLYLFATQRDAFEKLHVNSHIPESMAEISTISHTSRVRNTTLRSPNQGRLPVSTRRKLCAL